MSKTDDVNMPNPMLFKRLVLRERMQTLQSFAAALNCGYICPRLPENEVKR